MTSLWYDNNWKAEGSNNAFFRLGNYLKFENFSPGRSEGKSE